MSGVLGQQLLGHGLTAGGIVEGRCVRRAGDVGHRHVHVRIDRLGAIGVALDVVDHGRDDRGATDGRDVAGLAGASRDDAGQVARLLLAPVDALQVRQQDGRIAGAGEGGVGIAVLVDTGGLVDTDELDVRIVLGRLDRVLAGREADGHDDVVLLVHEAQDVGTDVGRGLADGVLRSRRADGLGTRLRAFPGVLVEVAVVDGADVGHDADLQVGTVLGQGGCGTGRGLRSLPA